MVEHEKEKPTRKDPWYKVWFQVYFSPSVDRYRSLVEVEGITAAKGALWFTVSVGLGAVFPAILYWATGGRIVHDDLRPIIMMEEMVSPGAGWMMWIMTGVVGVVISPLLFYAGVWIVHWLARKMGGEGNLNELGYLLGAIAAPNGIANTLIEGAVPTAWNLLLRLPLIGVQVILSTIAVRAIYRLGWGRSIAVIAVFSGITAAVALVIGGGLCVLGR
ncbi:MAG TPA: hypothetical protein G4O00_14015 [Thermoflexia bacterium]|jgi:hypothetical protein|nr:hypothetical protein [Thermoflexia bacterium]